jgi:hypothetical protein
MEVNGKSKRTMWDDPSDPNKKMTTEFVEGRAVDDGVNYDADIIEEEVRGLSDANRAFNSELEDERGADMSFYSDPEPDEEQAATSALLKRAQVENNAVTFCLGCKSIGTAIGELYCRECKDLMILVHHSDRQKVDVELERLRNDPVALQNAREQFKSLRPVKAERPTSMEMNGMELNKQPPGGWVGSPEKVDLLRKIGHAAAQKYPDQAIRIEPRDAQTQEVYTLSIRPKNLQRVDSVEKLRANNWVDIAGGSLSDLLAFCQKGVVVLLLVLTLATSALASSGYNLADPPSLNDPIETEGDGGFSPGDIAMYVGVVIGTPLLCLAAYFWLKRRHEQERSILVADVDYDGNIFGRNSRS